MSTLVRLRRLFVPASSALVLLIAAVWFIFSWVPSQRRYLDDRNFRVLNILSEQIRFTINNFDKMMDNAAAHSGITETDLDRYFSNVAPQLKVSKGGESKSAIGDDYSDPPKIAVVADEGTHFLYLAFEYNDKKYKNKSSRYAIRTDLDKLIDKLLPPSSRNPFDVVLLSKSDGTVVFQKPLSGLNVSQVEGLNEVVKKGKPDTQVQLNSLLQASSFEEVTLGGASYRLYSQPLKISFALVDPQKKSTNNNVAASIPAPWILCGLVRADHFRSESQSISYEFALWLFAFILIVFTIYPFLRLRYSRCEERLRARQVVTTTVSACVVAAIATFILLDLCYWRQDFEPSTEKQMQSLSAAIDLNFGNEAERVFKQLSDFYNAGKSELIVDLRKAQANSGQPPHLVKDGAACNPDWSCRAKILSAPPGVASLLNDYPYLEYVSWSDFDSNQRVKWTTKNSVTPFIRLDDDPSILYYPEVKSALRSPNPVRTDGFGPIYSPNTGKNVTVFWKLMDRDGEGPKDRDRKKAFCVSLTTYPLSVFDPILPEGFQFAIIQNDGTVVFHSDTTRNLHEDFFAETDRDRRLLSRVSMRTSGSLVANYMGRPHRLYVRPMSTSKDKLWTIVVFRDLRAEETMNLEMVSLASIMFLFYVAILAWVLLLIRWLQRDRVIGNWLWPDSRKTATYRRLVIANAAAALLLSVLSQISSPSSLIFLGIFVALVTIILNVLVLRRRDDRNSENDSKNPPPAGWQRAYVVSSATLLMVVAVVPCLCFFKVASDFERKLFIRSTQLSLVADIKKRDERVLSHDQGLDLGEYARELLAGVEQQVNPSPGEKPSFSYHRVTGTSITKTSTTDTSIRDGSITSSGKNDPVECGSSTQITRQRCVELFLSWSSPLYNELAAAGRYLAEGSSSDQWVWSSRLSDAEENLELTGQGRTISTPWTPFRVPLDKWQWWLGAAAFIVSLILLVRWALYRLFLLDRARPYHETISSAVLQRDSLIETLPEDLVIIGSESPLITDLMGRKDVQFWDIGQMPDHIDRFSVSVEDIVRDGKPLVLRIVDRALDDPASSRKIRFALERVLSKLGTSVVIISQVDPGEKSLPAESTEWRTLLSAFVRIDPNPSPDRKAGETSEQFESRVLPGVHYRWRFHGLSRSQRLVLVQLAQEGLVNPNCQSVVSELLEEGLIVRRGGLLTVNDRGFADFLKSAIPPGTVKRLESHGAGAGSDPLRMSLFVAGTGLVGFLIYTQGDAWIAYATGLAAAVPAFMKVVAIFRGKSGTEA